MVSLAVISSVAFSQTASLTASCAGSVSVNTVVWSVTPSGGVSPYAYLWQGTVFGGATSTSVTLTYNATGTHQANVKVTDASSTTADAACSATITTLPGGNATSTPPVVPPRRFKEPILNINPAGHFLARGMVIESVASGSFVGKVWGTTWTVNVLNGPELLFREGKFHKWFDVSQLKVGDEVGVSGFVDRDNPLTVNAQVVRNYTIVTERHDERVEERMEKKIDKLEDKMERKEDKMEKKENRGRGNAEEAAKVRARIDEIMKQIEDIKKKISR